VFVKATEKALLSLIARQAKSKPTKSKNMKMQYRETNAQIPLQMAYTQRQSGGMRNHVERIDEQIDSIVVGPTTGSGQLFEILLNPILMGGALTQMSQMYQKYRFRSFKFSVGVNMPTNTGGNYTVAYCENPDQAFGTPAAAPGQVYRLPGAVNKPWWQRGDSLAIITDRSKWYNIDADSNEIMSTTQGKFVVVNVSPPTVTAAVTVPIFIDCIIEFSGSAIQNNESVVTSLSVPASVMVKQGNFSYLMTPNVGESAIPAFVIGKPYYLGPNAPITDGNNDTQTAQVISAATATTFFMYESMADFDKQLYLGGPSFPASFPLTRSVASSPN
jgi:hypothetical protein